MDDMHGYIKELSQNRELETVIIYGNREGRDIDLFVLGSFKEKYERIVDGMFDTLFFDASYAFDLFTHLNPLVTEPILTGELVFGTDIFFLKEGIQEIDARGSHIQAHLLEYAHYVLGVGKVFLAEKKYDIVLENMCFCASFLDFARYYQTHRCAISLRELSCIPGYQLSFLLRQTMKEGTYSTKDILRHYASLEKILGIK